MSIVERAPAKVNLYLHVGAPLTNGRHPLESVVTFADAGDVITAHDGDGLRLAVIGPFAGDLDEEPDNLVLRAAREMALEAGIARPHAHLTLEKNLPVASGIGGGSSDAGATLRALNRLWSLDAPFEDLEEIARRLGADVPVCVRARSAFMTGTGEAFEPIELPVLEGILVNPDCGVPTAGVYQMFDQMRLGDLFERAPAPAWRSAHAAISGLRAVRNDLLPAALDLAPEVGETLDLLDADARALLARMSGSGATVFALCAEATAAASLARDVRAMRPHWWTTPARFGAVDVLSGAR
ncbi:MAG: 4-(cytidine 5'-diphospho)-2-C-methyl-D-erythritol kinase [Alphaproteobacteria bacterium]|nr:4-(cytidine 5'-diphospho)-2-C-methyl-D-erythritol kinase [Alphaproteobacteria bacterium]